MTDKQNERSGAGRCDELTKVLDAVDAAHDAVPRSGGDSFLSSIRRIHAAAERMLGQGDARTRSELQTGAEAAPSHWLGAAAEHVAAMTIATFGGRNAVRDLRKWTRRPEPKDRSSR